MNRERRAGNRLICSLPAVFIGCGMLLAARSTEAVEIIKSEFIFDRAPFRSCHASTVAETASGLVAAWFGGSEEGKPDVTIWSSRQEAGAWSAPVEVATGVQSNGLRYPCWNPVLFQALEGPLLLFYKVGPKPSNWWGLLITSENGGKTWSQPQRLPENILGPIRAKPVMIEGKLWCGSSTEHAGWRIHLEFTSDLGHTWTRTAPLNDGKKFTSIQPTILPWSLERVQLLCRSEQKRVVETWTRDGGQTFSLLKATAMRNPSTGVDSVLLKDGRALFVYNNTTRGRTPLSIDSSANGTNWTHVLTLEKDPGEYSYPAMIVTRDGLVHVTYTWKRERIKHVVIKP